MTCLNISFHSFAEANEWSQIYGMLLLPVAIAFCAYALWMYTKRAAMIRRKDPGPCEPHFFSFIILHKFSLFPVSF